MKKIKIMSLLILAINFSACEPEKDFPELENKDNSSISLIKIDEFGNINKFQKNKSIFPKSNNKVETSINIQFYESLSELSENCIIQERPVESRIGDRFTAAFLPSDSFFMNLSLLDQVQENEIFIEILNSNNETIYSEYISIYGPTFYGFTSNEKFSAVVLTQTEATIYLSTLDNGLCHFSGNSDADADGFPDNEDVVPNSNMEESVMIYECDTFVKNIALGRGLMISDKIDELEESNYKNHGHFVKSISKYLNSLKKAGFLSGKEKGAIMKCTKQPAGFR